MIKQSLIARLKKLQARSSPLRVPPIQYTNLTKLPDTYVGEKHVVLVSRTTRSDGTGWYELEERPGAALGPGEDPFRRGDAFDAHRFHVPLWINLTQNSKSENSDICPEISSPAVQSSQIP